MDSDGYRSSGRQPAEEKQNEHKVRKFLLGWLVALNKGVTKLLKWALVSDYIEVTEDEVLDLVNALAQTPDDDGGENVIEESSAQMINNIFEFKDMNAGDVMTHRTNIVGVDMSVTLDDLIYLALDMGFSRIPVYDGSIDKIVGIVIVKDLLCLVGKDREALDNFNVRDFIRDVIFIPESCPCSETFKSLTSLKSGMAVVADEYGGTAGIVTLEDIIEAVMGNIQDEYDDEKSEIVKIGDDQYDIDGEADPDEVFALFGVELPEEHEYETIAGFVTDKLGYIPEGDEIAPPSVEYEGVKLVVLQVEDRCILKIRASRMPQAAESEDNTDG
ncbi:MAG: hemolysin family protein [Oscillospiraceae bacterium]